MSSEYKRSTITKYRSGTGDDPYVSISQSEKVINQSILLNEIPDFNTKVQISNMFEILDDNESDMLSNQYRIDYSEGLAFFHPSREGQTLTLAYKGTGNHYVSADRVWTQQTNGNVTETLGELIEAGETALTNLGLVNDAISHAESATTNANNAAASVSTVVSGESARVSAENIRISSESTRSTNESARISSEATRTAAESGRVSAETTRTTSETTRIGNESTRQSNETTRQSQESSRQTNTTTAITNLNNLKNSFLYDKNAYSSTKSYVVNNLITYQGRTYICILNTIGNPPSNATYWQVFAEKGIDGLGTVTALTASTGDIIIEGTAVYPDLIVNTGINPNQLVKRNASGDMDGNITGNAATVTTNANLTGAVTSTGNVTALSAGIDAAKIANGTVLNTEFQYLDGVTSSIQTQLNSKATTSSVDSALGGWKKYNDISELGLTAGSETMETICTAMIDKSELVYIKATSNTSSAYPSTAGILTVTRLASYRTELHFRNGSSSGAINDWIGYFDINITPNFTGWKKVITDTGVQVINNGLQATYLNAIGNGDIILDDTSGNNPTISYKMNGSLRTNLFHDATNDKFALRVYKSDGSSNSTVNLQFPDGVTPTALMQFPVSFNWAGSGLRAAIDMNNSDIIGANCIYFAEDASAGEGLFWAKTGITVDSTVASDYTVLRVDGAGTGWIGSDKIHTDGNTVQTRLTNGLIEYFNGTGWVPMGGGATFIYAPSSNVMAQLLPQYTTPSIPNGSTGLYLAYAWTPACDGFINVSCDLWTSASSGTASLYAIADAAGKTISSGSGQIFGVADDSSFVFNYYSPQGTSGVTQTGGTTSTIGSTVGVETWETKTKRIAVFAGVTVYFAVSKQSSGTSGTGAVRNIKILADKVVSV